MNKINTLINDTKKMKNFIMSRTYSSQSQVIIHIYDTGIFYTALEYFKLTDM